MIGPLGFYFSKLFQDLIFLGGSGVHAVGAAISHSVGNQSDRDKNLEIFCEIATKNELTPTVVHRCGSDELL